MEESSFPLKAVAGVVIVIAALGGGLFWLLTLPVTYTGPEGYEVSVPHGWEVKPVEGGMTAAGVVEGNRWGSANASYHPFSGGGRPAWPESALALFGVRPDEYRTDEIDKRPAVILVFREDARKFLAAVVDRGDGLIVYRIGCAAEDFDAERAGFERLARRIRCAKS